MYSAVTPLSIEFTFAMKASGNEFSRPRRTPMCMASPRRAPRPGVGGAVAILPRDPDDRGMIRSRFAEPAMPVTLTVLVALVMSAAAAAAATGRAPSANDSLQQALYGI